MKRNSFYYHVWRCFLTVGLLCSMQQVHTQGRVLINEYLPWPNNACGVTAEFIELFNFGPGPMNIGCYIITDGDFSITIPPNTILQPGQYYVLAGQNIIPQNCGNDLRDVTVNLNWNTCGCTSGTIPVTGDGLMTDGGAGNEQLVLFSPNLQVIDAVVRDLPVETSAAITTSTLGGVCTAKTFDLDTMNIQYETIGESTGRGNSMAREVDGGCRWIKDTQESAGDENNTSSSLFSIDAALTITNPLTCSNTGSVNISVLSGNLAQLFPVQYLLAKDADSNNTFNFLDSYTYAVDSSAPAIPITNLTSGRYQVVIGSSRGCDLTPFDFTILGCTAILPATFTRLQSMVDNKGNIKLVWNVANPESAHSFVIEQSDDGKRFSPVAIISNTQDSTYQYGFFYLWPASVNTRYCRIRLVTAAGSTYSGVLKIAAVNNNRQAVNVFPNPVTGNIIAHISSGQAGAGQLVITSSSGKIQQVVHCFLQCGENVISIPAHSFAPGIYYLRAWQNRVAAGSVVKVIIGR